MPKSATSNKACEPLEEWSHRIADIPDSGLDAVRAATTDELAALADALELLALAHLNVTYRIRPLGAGRYKVKGELTAAVTQACIVTLEPVHADIHENFEEEFWPQDLLSNARAEAETEDREALSDSTAEAIQQGLIEVGRLVYEQFSTAINPYPRTPDAEFAWREAGGEASDDERNNPFASLAALKDKT